jgi:hypothetical protein
MNYLFGRSSIWLLAAALIVAFGGWLYTQRVLVAHQSREAAAHDRPRGNLSDLYPRWLGARELLLHGRDPYSPEVTREIQAGYYGRPLDPSLPNDPRDKSGFAYPIYVSFLLAPVVKLPFAVVQKAFFWLLVVLISASLFLWLRILRWSPGWVIQLSMLLLTLSSIAVIQGLKLQQISLFVAGLVAIASALFVADQAVAAGMVLAIATIKPQLVLLLLVWLAIWTSADWRRRYRWVVSFVLSMAILCGAGELFLPHWIPRFWNAVRDYQNYTGSASVLDGLIGAPWSWIFELLALGALLVACWRERRNLAGSNSFALMLSMVLAATVLLVPISAQYNQVLLIPTVLLLVKDRRAIWTKSTINRALLVTTAALIVWPWISSTALAGLSFILPTENFERIWAAPIWTTVQTPVALTALVLVHYYQLSFHAPAKPTRRRMLGNQPPPQDPRRVC